MLFVNACDYKPLYSTNNVSNFNIVSLEIKGDKNINNFLERNFRVYQNKNSEKNYKISLNTAYSKDILAKDKTANTTDYKLTVSVEMIYSVDEIDIKEKTEKKIIFSEVLNIKKDTNNFEQANYENISKINLSEIILNKIIVFLNSRQ